MRRLILALSLVAMCSNPAQAQGFVRLYGGDQGAQAPLPATTSNPVPVSVNGSISGNVAVTSTVNPTGTSLANSTSSTVTITGSAQTVSLTAASTNVTITNYSNATLNIAFTGTASSSNYGIPAGASFTYTGVPAVSSFSAIGTSGTFGVLAH